MPSQKFNVPNINTKPYETFVCVGDNHGDLVDKSALDAFDAFLIKENPGIRIHLGDLLDLGAWRTGASQDDQSQGTNKDVDAGLEFLRMLKPQVFHLGNHDKRALEQRESYNGDRAECANNVCVRLFDQLTAIDCKEVHNYSVRGSDAKAVGLNRKGKLVTTHGFAAGTNATRTMAQICGRPGDVVIHGHTHDFHMVTIPHLEDAIVGVSSMCLMDINLADYALTRPATTRWANGWTHGVIENNTGLCKVWTAHRFAGKFIYSEGFNLI
jgi:predicted phosphodiesterase